MRPVVPDWQEHEMQPVDGTVAVLTDDLTVLEGKLLEQLCDAAGEVRLLVCAWGKCLHDVVHDADGHDGVFLREEVLAQSVADILWDVDKLGLPRGQRSCVQRRVVDEWSRIYSATAD